MDKFRLFCIDKCETKLAICETMPSRRRATL